MTLDEACSGNLQTGPFGSQLHADEYVAEGVPVVMPKDIVGGRIVADTAARITPERAQQLRRHRLQAGDVIFSRRGDVARAGLVSEADEDCLCGTGCLRARPDKERVVPAFLNLLVQSPQSKTWLESNAVGQTMPNMNTEILSQLTFKLPSLCEQECISSTTTTWDAAIEKTEQLIAAKELCHRALHVRLLGKNLWSESCHERADALFEPASERNRPDLPVLAVTQDQGVVPRTMLDRRITMELSDPATFKVVRKDDFVISLRSFQGGLEHSAYEGLVSPAYTVLRCGSNLNPRFYRHYLKSPDFLKRLAVAVIGIRDGKQINFTDFASIKLPLPQPERQARIAAILDESEKEIALLRKQANQLRKQKRGLMQKLLTGQWRVKAPETEAA